jgi:hypothetical protein
LNNRFSTHFGNLNKMNANIEYEKFTQEIYQELVNADVLKATRVQHNVKLKSKSGQEHQIDVYWEYEIAGVRHRVAIECKNYNRNVEIGKVRDFYGVLSDLNNVAGIMVTKVGYQKGAKEYASTYGITLKELREPNWGEAILGQIELNLNMSIRHCLFRVDKDYEETGRFSVTRYKLFLDAMRLEMDSKWSDATHIPLELINRDIIDASGKRIASLDEIEATLPKNSDTDIIFNYEDAYVNTRRGRIKINEVKYEFEKKNHKRIISIDAKGFVKAILKDAINGDIKMISR